MTTGQRDPTAGWARAHLGDVLKCIEAGVSPKTLDRPAREGEVGVLKVSAVTWKVFRPLENKAVFPEFNVTGVPTVQRGDLLLSRANTAELLASPVLVDRDYRNLILSDKTLRLVPDERLADGRYLLYALSHEDARRYFASRATGTSGSMRNVTQAAINEYPLPLPPLGEQKRIADVLDKADEIRRKRDNAISRLAQYPSAVFYELFGDPQSNPKQWRRVALRELIADGDKINYGVVQPGSECTSGVPIIRVGDLRNLRVSLVDLKKIEAEIEAQYNRSRLVGNEVLVACVGTIGLVALADERVAGFNIARAVARIRCGPKLDRHYLAAYLATPAIQNYFRQETRTVSQPTLNIDHIEKTAVLVPPRAAQDAYAEIVKRHIGLLERYELAAAEAKALSDCLIQRAFRGEL